MERCLSVEEVDMVAGSATAVRTRHAPQRRGLRDGNATPAADGAAEEEGVEGEEEEEEEEDEAEEEEEEELSVTVAARLQPLLENAAMVMVCPREDTVNPWSEKGGKAEKGGRRRGTSSSSSGVAVYSAGRCHVDRDAVRRFSAVQPFLVF